MVNALFPKEEHTGFVRPFLGLEAIICGKNAKNKEGEQAKWPFSSLFFFCKLHVRATALDFVRAHAR